MKKLWVLLGIAFVISCQKDDFCGCMLVDIGVNMSVSDANGNDLLDPATLNAIKKEDIKLFRVENGTLKEVVNANADYSGDFMIYQLQNSKYHLRLMTPETLTYIQWKGTDMDTLQCEFKTTSNSKICTKVWYNSKLVYDTKNNTERFFEVTR
jgi:hypothetical protein